MRTKRRSHIFQDLVDEELAATHIEYALLGGFMGVLLMGGLLSLEDGLTTFYTGLAGILAAILS
jgi:Flp pilus assembly pilin Flp